MNILNKDKKIKKQGFMKGVVILMFSQVMIKILGLIYRMYLTNRQGFGDKGNAIYGSGFQIYALLLTISSIGVPNAVSKIVSERVAIGDNKGAHKVFKIALVTFGLLGFICSMFLFVGAESIANNWIQISEVQSSLEALAPSIFFVSLICVIRGYFNGRECVKVTANSQIIEQIFKTLLTVIIVEIVAIGSGLDTAIMAAGANLATTFASILCFCYLYMYYTTVKKEIAREVKNTVNYKYKGIRKIIKEILNVSVPMSLTPILATINKNIDSITVVRGLKNFLTESVAKAQYGILTGKVDTLITLPMSFNIAFTTALVPAVSSDRATGNIGNAKKRIQFSLLISILIGLPCTVGMIIFAKAILQLLFPNQTSGEFILQVSATSILFIVLEQTISGVLQGIGKPLVPAMSLLVGVIVKFILNKILIPINPEIFFLGGTVGAAISTTICHMIACLIDFYIMNKYIKLEISKKDYILKPIIATIMMTICLVFIYNSLICMISQKLSTIISILIASVLYIILIFLLKIFSKENIFMIPYGQKIYKTLQSIGIYKKEQNIKNKSKQI